MRKVKVLIVLMLIFGISIGYSYLSSTIGVVGNVDIINAFYKLKISSIRTSIESDDINIGYKETISLKIKSNDGYYLYEAKCDPGYTLNNVETGINSYGKEQTVNITNNIDGGGTCSFYSKELEASELDYVINKHPNIKNAKDALDYLYRELGYPDLPMNKYQAKFISYSNEEHPELTDVEKALDYIYDKVL